MRKLFENDLAIDYPGFLYKENNMRDTISQNNAILAYMANGHHITPLEALNKFGCMRLGARIYDLKGRGYPIGSRLVKDESGKRYSEYWMVKL